VSVTPIAQPEAPAAATKTPPPVQQGARATKAPVRGQWQITEGSGDTRTTLSALFSQYAPLGYFLPWETLDYIELLATYNPDYSQAVDNIRTLANSGHELFVDARSSRTSERIKSRLEEKARTIQAQHGGMDGLLDKLLDQAATYGAMCGEWVLNEDLTDVVDFVDINPKSIRFLWDEKKQIWQPYQKVTPKQAAEARDRGQKIVAANNYVELNTETFRYFAFDAAPQSPYGTPPFLAALGNIAIQRDMVHNMSQIVKKVGLLGIIDIVVKQLPMQAGESDADYQARASGYLDSYVEVVQDMVRDGGLVHYDDIEVQTYNITGNAAGATNIFKQNEELIFSGLKSMPSVQGRSYSTTETYAGVAYDIIIRNTRKYQRAAKRMIEDGYWLMCSMWGEQPKALRLTFNENKTLHRVQDAQAEALEIKNGLALWATGAIDQLGFVQRLGISSPKTEYDLPPESRLIGNAASGNLATGDEGGDPTEDRSDDEDTRSDE
jgi:hypothetical protein